MNEQIEQQQSARCGYVAIVGRPNVGKSTLMNRSLGKKLSITSRKPQTTRHRITGVKTVNDIQIIYVDTPGIHLQQKKAINKHMNKVAQSVLSDVDLIVWVVEADRWTTEDQRVCEVIEKSEKPVILAVNKVDQVKPRELLLPYLDKMQERLDFITLVPLSAKTGEQVDCLEQAIVQHLPESMHYFPPEQFTDRSDRFIVSEIVREQLMRQLGQELPYATTVTVDELHENSKRLKIAAVIWVERDSQKAIVIGQGGSRLKNIGQQCRGYLEMYFEKSIYIDLWVKVKKGWSDNVDQLSRLGYDD